MKTIIPVIAVFPTHLTYEAVFDFSPEVCFFSAGDYVLYVNWFPRRWT
jgi:hypothetical protein